MSIAALALLAAALSAPHAGATTTRTVSCQGIIGGPTQVGARTTGAYAVDLTLLDGTSEPSLFRVAVTGRDGTRHELRLRGEAFLVSDLGLIVSVRRPETSAIPAMLSVFDCAGREVWTRQVEQLSSPVLSPGGTHLAFRSAGGTFVVDLATFREERHPRLSPFAVGPTGAIAGISTEAGQVPSHDRLALYSATGGAGRSFPIPERPERLAYGGDGSSLLVLWRRELAAFDTVTGAYRTLTEAPGGAEFRDLKVEEDALLVGLRTTDGATVSGSLAVLDPDGTLVGLTEGPSKAIHDHPPRADRDTSIPWPLAPNEQHEVGNTYGEYQNYSGSPYLHPGVDAMGYAGQPVYAVADGVVKAVLTTSGEWHWRVATSDSATTALCTGYLYAHLDLPTIAVSVGDAVVEGQYLGDLVEWPTSGFHHIHFARIQDEGLQWYGDWLTTDNPHLDFEVQTESVAPVFETAKGNDLLAFCFNESSVYQDSDALNGEVDIIAHVGDTIESSWVCTVQEIRYTIYPLGFPQFPVVADKLAVNFDMALDTYYGGPIDPFLVDLFYKQDSTCRTRGDYQSREFYHVITNSDGDEVYDSADVWEAWNTTELPDAEYVVRVTATDAAGNAAADSMVVTTANGNPTWISPEAGVVALHMPHPNPARERATVAFSLPARGDAFVGIYSPSGRLVRALVDREFPAGSHVVTWDGTDSTDRPVGSGVYFARLEASGGSRIRKIVLAR